MEDEDCTTSESSWRQWTLFKNSVFGLGIASIDGIDDTVNAAALVNALILTIPYG